MLPTALSSIQLRSLTEKFRRFPRGYMATIYLSRHGCGMKLTVTKIQLRPLLAMGKWAWGREAKITRKTHTYNYCHPDLESGSSGG